MVAAEAHNSNPGVIETPGFPPIAVKCGVPLVLPHRAEQKCRAGLVCAFEEDLGVLTSERCAGAFLYDFTTLYRVQTKLRLRAASTSSRSRGLGSSGRPLPSVTGAN